MRKKHFQALSETVGRALDQLSQWSEPGTAGRLVSLDTVETVLIGEMSTFVGAQGGDAARWVRETAGSPLTERLRRCRDKAVEVYETDTVDCKWCGQAIGVNEPSTVVLGEHYHDGCGEQQRLRL